ncbi:MAG TPA: ring-cleaving dioxygenase [Thermoanaerobaculia bacterium]|nr:ring-cleaving dioxygenase [Thermoanaerobaculia bacterium]
MTPVGGLHHVTAIAGPPQENLDFYVGVLGMRLVKRSVNQDDPGTYHLFYADAEGHPGTDLTFFPWARMAPSRQGHGLSSEVALAVPPGSLEWWASRLRDYGLAHEALETRFGERALPFTDPHGLRVALVESQPASGRGFTPWAASPVPGERQVRGLHAARLVVRELAPTAAFVGQAMGYSDRQEEAPWRRFQVGAGGSGRWLDVREEPAAPAGAWGTGSIHHLAFRVADEEHQLALRSEVLRAGMRPTPVIDRFWFRSVYFREPGGVLFELATDGPGFAVDEAPEALGETLVLPPWLERDRPAIERALPPLAPPGGAASG